MPVVSKKSSLIISLFIVILLISTYLVIGKPIFTTSNDQDKNFIEYPEKELFIPDIVVPDDCNTIQDAIDNSDDYGKILVKSGIYKENVEIDRKGLDIRGENKYNTIIDGGKVTNAVVICAPNVNFEGFTVTNGLKGNMVLWYISGIKIDSSDVTVKGNIITRNRLGLNTGAEASNLTIIDNQFIDDGLLLQNFEYTKITKENSYHTIRNNTVNGKPLYYFTDKNDFKVPLDAGQIILVNCTNAIIENLYLTDTDFSILLYYCSNCIIKNSTVIDTDGEICTVDSDNNLIQNNVASNSLHGICLDFKSDNNIIKHNTVFKNGIGISIMTGSSNNEVYDNEIYENGMYGFWLHNRSTKNEIRNNNIYQNGKEFNNGASILVEIESSNNLIHNNDIKQNKKGIIISDSSENKIIKNNFRKNKPINAFFIGSSDNTFSNNYWNRPRILPKVIFGLKTDGILSHPSINFDKKPNLTPNET